MLTFHIKSGAKMVLFGLFKADVVKTLREPKYVPFLSGSPHIHLNTHSFGFHVIRVGKKNVLVSKLLLIHALM